MSGTEKGEDVEREWRDVNERKSYHTNIDAAVLTGLGVCLYG